MPEHDWIGTAFYRLTEEQAAVAFTGEQPMTIGTLIEDSRLVQCARCDVWWTRADGPCTGGVRSTSVDRNAPCSCGSGKKSKRCCEGKTSRV